MMSPDPGMTVAVPASRPTNGVGKSTIGVDPKGPDTDTRLAELSPIGFSHEPAAGEQPTSATADRAVASARATGRAVKCTETSFDTISLFTESSSVLGESLGVAHSTAQAFL